MAYFDNLFSGSSGKSSSPSSGGRYFSDLKFSSPKKQTTKSTPTVRVNTNKTITIGGLTFDGKTSQNSSSAQLVNVYKALTTPPKPKTATISGQGLTLDLKPKQEKLNEKQLAQTKAITLPNGNVIQPSTLSAAPKKEDKPNIFTLARRWVDSLFGISPEERARMELYDEVARAQNAYALKKEFPELTKDFSLTDLTKPGGNPFKESPFESASKKALEEAGVPRTLNNKEFTDVMFALSLPVSLGAGAAGLAPSVMTQLGALGKFTAVSLAYRTALEKLTGKHGISEFLPEETPMPITIAVDAVEFLGEAILSHGIKPGKALDFFTKETINKYKLPEKFELNSTQVNDIVKGGKLTTAEQKRAFKDLGLTDAQIQKAQQNGIKIEIPSQNVAKVVDRSYWADIKRALKVEPTTGERVAPKGTITVRRTLSTDVVPGAEVKTIGSEVKVYRGAKNQTIDVSRENGITRGVSFSTDKAVAERFAVREGGKVGEYFISPDARVVNHSSLEKMSPSQVAEFLKKNEVDVVKFDIPKGAKGEAELRVINDKVLRTTPAPPKPKPVPEGKTPSKIAKSIERKAIEDELTKGFENLAGYDKITIKEQAALAERLFRNPDRALRVIRGEEPLPKNLRGTAVITAAEARIKATGDKKLAYELANSPLVSETSLAAQELRLAAERVPDSLTIKMRELKAAREASLKKRTGQNPTEAVKQEVGKIKAEVQKKNPTKEDWSSFIKSIEC